MKKKSENIFSQEEKDNILNKLNAERKKHQEEEKEEEKHSEYTEDEKNNILNKLNAERKKKQEEEEEKEEEKKEEEKHFEYTEDEKNNIFEELDDKRRKKQDKDKIHKYKYGNKKVYNLENREFYKIIGLGREFFIKTEDCHNHDSRPETLSLYHHGFDGLRKTEALVNFKDSSDKIFISEDKLRVYFKASSLEEI